MTTIQSIITFFTDLLLDFVSIGWGLAVAAFFYGLARYIFSRGSEDSIAKGKYIMTWGIIAMFVMSAIWGIVLFLQGVFGITVGTITPTIGNPFGPQ